MVLTNVPMDGLAPFSSLVPYRVRLVSNSCSVAVGVGSLQQRASLAYSANVPPACQRWLMCHHLQPSMHLGWRIAQPNQLSRVVPQCRCEEA